LIRIYLLIPRKINDAHVHLGRSSIINQSLSLNEIHDFRKKFNIENMFLMSLDVDIEQNNKTVIKLTHKHNFVHGLYWIKKTNIESDAITIKNELKNGGLVGVKFHGTFEKLPVTDPVYEPVMNILDEHKSILLIHAGRFKDGSPESTTSYFHALKLAKNYPNIKVIVAHMGGNDTSIVKEAVENSKYIPNVYFDISGVSTPYRIEYATEVIGSEKILFGSDSPWCSVRAMYYNVEDALIDEKSKNNILYENFLKLINIESR